MSIILGIKGGRGMHNSSIAILDTEKDDIMFVGEEERFNGEKHTDCFPVGALTYAFQNFNLKYTDIDYIALGHNESDYMSGYWHGFNQLSVDKSINLQKIKDSCFDHVYQVSILKAKLRQMFPSTDIISINHHDTHAALAFYCSSFEEADVFTSDGLGEAEAMTFSQGAGHKLQRLYSINYPNSLGFMYSYFCHILDYAGPNPEGKIMALASFGKPIFIESFRKLYSSPTPFSFEFNREFITLTTDGEPPIFKNYNMYAELFGGEMPRALTKEPLKEIHYNIASSLQAFFEEMIIKLANDLQLETGSKNICVGGGSFLNSVVNNKILDYTKFENIYVNPASHDGGNGLGAALYLKHKILRNNNKTNFSAYLGYKATEQNAKTILHSQGIVYTAPYELNKEVAKLLNEGAVIGWVKGKAEIGPRALCNRSILVAPTKKETIDYLNKEIKRREWFRPYAPVVMAEHANKYFEFKNGETDSPYMLKVQNILPDAIDKIPAISHIDGTARTQTLTKEQNPEMYDLLNEYSKLSGIHVLLNTSFNIGGESIINNEQEALLCFIVAKLDYLVLDKFLISKKDNQNEITRFLASTTMKDYFHSRKQQYLNQFGEFIHMHEDIFTSSIKRDENGVITIFSENQFEEREENK